MDGYAVRAQDATAGATLKLQGRTAAGHGFNGALEAGARPSESSPARRYCPRGGAPTPSSSRKNDRAGLTTEPCGSTRTPIAGRHIRKAGVDSRPASTGSKAGACSTRRHHPFAAAMKHAVLPIRAHGRRWRWLPTGDELRVAGESLGPGQILGSNTFGVAARALGAGAEVIDLGHRTPTGWRRSTRRLIRQLSQGSATCLWTIGGRRSSVRRSDLVQGDRPSGGARGHDARFLEDRAMRPVVKPLDVGTARCERARGRSLAGKSGPRGLVGAHLFLEPAGDPPWTGRPDPQRIP